MLTQTKGKLALESNKIFNFVYNLVLERLTKNMYHPKN